MCNVDHLIILFIYLFIYLCRTVFSVLKQSKVFFFEYIVPFINVGSKSKRFCFFF